MKHTDPKDYIHQLMHAVFDGAKQLTKWRTCKVATLAALRRSSHRAKGEALTKSNTDKRGELKTRFRNYAGLVVKSKIFVTPPRETATA